MDQPTDNIVTVSVSHLISHRRLDFEAALHPTIYIIKLKYSGPPNGTCCQTSELLFSSSVVKATVIKEETYWLVRLWEFILRVFFQALNCNRCISYVGELRTIISFSLITCLHYSWLGTIKAVKRRLKHGCTTFSWSKCVIEWQDSRKYAHFLYLIKWSLLVMLKIF